MKKYNIVFYLLLIFMTGCSSEKVNEIDTDMIDLVDATPVISDSMSDMEIEEAYTYLMNSFLELDCERSSVLFYEFESMALEEQLDSIEYIVLDEKAQKELDKWVTENQDIQSLGENKEKMSPAVEKLVNSGFTFVNYEGIYYPVFAYNQFDQVSNCFNEETESYINLKSLELDDRMATKSLEKSELEIRLVDIENHLKYFKGGKTEESILKTYKSYLYEYLPSENAHIDTTNIDPSNLETYEAFVISFPETMTASVIQKYLTMIESDIPEEEPYDVLNAQIEMYCRDIM